MDRRAANLMGIVTMMATMTKEMTGYSYILDPEDLKDIDALRELGGEIADGEIREAGRHMEEMPEFAASSDA